MYNFFNLLLNTLSEGLLLILVSTLFHKTAPAYLAVLLPYCVVFILEIKVSPFAAFRVL